MRDSNHPLSAELGSLQGIVNNPQRSEKVRADADRRLKGLIDSLFMVGFTESNKDTANALRQKTFSGKVKVLHRNEASMSMEDTETLYGLEKAV